MVFDPAPPFEVALLIVIVFYIVVGLIAGAFWLAVRSIRIRRKDAARKFSRKFEERTLP